MNWTLDHIEKLKDAGRIQDYKITSGPKEQFVENQSNMNDNQQKKDPGKKCRAQKLTNCKSSDYKPLPNGLLFIVNTLLLKHIPFVREYQFAKPRKFRFDVALPERMIAIEFEGLVSTGKKGGHQTKKHYTKDCVKYNLAAENGWKVYRYTFMNYKDFTTDLIKIIA